MTWKFLRGTRWLIYMSTQAIQKLNNESDPPREVRLSCTARAMHAFDLNRKLISFARCSCAVGGRRDNPEAPAVSHPRLQRHRCPGLRCDRCGPCDRRVAAPRSGGFGFSVRVAARGLTVGLGRDAPLGCGRGGSGPSCAQTVRCGYASVPRSESST